MRKTIPAIAVIALTTMIAATPTIAAESSREEKIGVSSGAVIGAIAGGPVGFIIGATIGAKVGDTMHQKNESLQQSQQDIRLLRNDFDAVSAELERIQPLARPDLINMLQAGIAMDLLFRTDEYVLVDTTGDRLASLGRTLASMPDVQIQLDGFADERGDADYNYALSQDRVTFVRDQLIAAGVDPSRIQLAAHGEVAAQDASVDSYALERRVSLTLFIDESRSVARLPE